MKDQTLELFDLVSNLIYFVPFTESPWFLNVSWTLGVETQFYLLLSLIYPLLVSNCNLVRRLSFAIFVLLCFSTQILPSSINSWYVCPHGHHSSHSEYLHSSCTSAKYALKNLPNCCPYGGSFNNRIHQLLTLVAILTTFLIFSLPSGKKVIGHSTGKISYSLYLVHLPIIILLAELMKPLGFIDRFQL